ncbi:MAG: metal ABC transporter permease [Mangrovibacterium sp.]
MNSLIELFQYNFFNHAALASLFAAISCGIIGTYIVSRRIVFISGGITHASFGGIGISYYFGLNPLLGAATFSILSALGMEYFTRSAKIRADSSIAIWWSLGMAIGIIFIYLTPGYAPNLMSYLFGSILTVSMAELYFMAALSALLIFIFTFMQRTILYSAFDESFAKTSGLPVKELGYFMMSLIAITIVLNIRVVGIILIMSLLTIPQATANLFTKNFTRMMWLSVLVAFVGAFLGLIVSFYADIPSGATIIVVLIALFGICKIIKSRK